MSDLYASPRQASSDVHGFPAETQTDPAEYLNTQTLGGGKGYFHTENNATSAPVSETPLVKASRGGESPAAAETQRAATGKPEAPTPAPTDLDPKPEDLGALTNADLIGRLNDAGIPVPKPANKAALVKALRG